MDQEQHWRTGRVDWLWDKLHVKFLSDMQGGNMEVVVGGV